jgi:acetolactate synthase-1/2/3 large subunit
LRTKASDYLFAMLKERGVENIFCVTGGASAHLMESARISGIKTIHCYHEQACAMAADAYARINKKPAVVLVTNGPGASNTITGVLGAYQDSIPMIVISGQVPRAQTIAESGRNLRQFGVQEADITKLTSHITKYCKTITDSTQFVQIANEAWNAATTGRMGPAWLEIPLDVQSEMIFPENINPILPISHERNYRIDDIISAIFAARRPVIIAGAGIHLANCENNILELVKQLGVPVASTWNASDLFNYQDSLYVGNFGLLGERAANFAVQHADLLLILGSRMSIPNIGYATTLFSPDSFKIMVDIDPDEMWKNSLSIDLRIEADLADFIPALIEKTSKVGNPRWAALVHKWKNRFIVFNEEHRFCDNKINSYDFMKIMSQQLIAGDVVVTDMGTSFTCTMQSLRNTGVNRLFTSSACCSMGFGLPGAIGAYFADPARRIICIAGDGGFQMNIQELQTIVHYRIPVKIFILNSNGYLAISLMQENLFSGKYFGSNPESGVSSPEFSRIANAYGITSFVFDSPDNLTPEALSSIMAIDGPVLTEVSISANQLMIPRVQSQRDINGKIISGSIDQMFPFLSSELTSQLLEELATLSEVEL